jgi:hypothetical protein
VSGTLLWFLSLADEAESRGVVSTAMALQNQELAQHAMQCRMGNCGTGALQGSAPGA